jgi:hypothetical protein
MESKAQSIDDLLQSLSPLNIEWQDDVARQVIAVLDGFAPKLSYEVGDIAAILDSQFEVGLLVARLFLGLSKDTFQAEFSALLGTGGCGSNRYRRDRAAFLAALEQMGLLREMTATVNRAPKWCDVLVERLRSGRGSAVSGQKRGRHVEDFVEAIVTKVFGDDYETRCTFIGQRDRVAKCDIAIPSKQVPRIVIEAKGYGATGSKMSDVIGDIEQIIRAKRSDTTFMFFTDGLTWMQRKSDFRKIVEFQNQGDIFRIYTLKLAEAFRADLEMLKAEQRL